MTKTEEQFILNHLYQSLDPMIFLTKKIPRDSLPNNVQHAIVAILKAIVELEGEEEMAKIIQFPNANNLRKDH
jgi:hypothetical protein